MHQERIGSFQCFGTVAPRRDALEHVHRAPDGTIAHRDDAQIRTMGKQRRQAGGLKVRGTGRGITAGRAGLRKATPALHRHEQLCKTDTGQVRRKHAAQCLDAWRHVEGIIPFGAQAVLLDRHKGRSRQAGHGLPGAAIKGLAELPECRVGLPRHGQLGIRLVALLSPVRVVIDPLPKGDLASARREIAGARA
jgi:hypothetical protein